MKDIKLKTNNGANMNTLTIYYNQEQNFYCIEPWDQSDIKIEVEPICDAFISDYAHHAEDKENIYMITEFTSSDDREFEVVQKFNRYDDEGNEIELDCFDYDDEDSIVEIRCLDE